MGEEYAYILTDGSGTTVVVGKDYLRFYECVTSTQGVLRHSVDDLERAKLRIERATEDLLYFRAEQGRLERVIAYIKAHPGEELNVKPYEKGNEDDSDSDDE